MCFVVVFVVDGNCPLYSSSGYRLQFLGGFNDTSDDALNSQMCYKYKLHEYRHKKGLKSRSDSDKVTVSMKICNNDDSANGIVSDYLKKVTLYNNNENDSYYSDNTHFYYVQNGGDSNDTIIELCFSPNDILSDRDAKIVSETEYCIQHNSDDKLCSKRGIFMTDICGLDSITRDEYHEPATDIDYIPIAGQLYKLSKTKNTTTKKTKKCVFCFLLLLSSNFFHFVSLFV